MIETALADTLPEAEALVTLAAARATPLVLGFNRRFAPDYVALRTVDANLIVMDKHRHRQPDLPRSVVFDGFIHVVDTLLSLVPAPIRRRTIETHVVDDMLHSITLTLAGDGFTAIGMMHRNSGLDEERMDVIGCGRVEASGILPSVSKRKVRKACKGGQTGSRSDGNAPSKRCATTS